MEKDVEDEEVEKGMAEEKVLEHGDGDNGGGGMEKEGGDGGGNGDVNSELRKKRRWRSR